MEKHKTNIARFTIKYTGVAMLVIMLIAISIMAGAVDINRLPSDIAHSIIWEVRLPRTLAALGAGASIATSGVLIQNVLHNPLGSPNVLGLNSSAVFAVTLATSLFNCSSFMLPFVAFLGVAVALLLVCSLSSLLPRSKHNLVLIGVACNVFFSAANDFFLTLYPNSLYAKISFRLGSLSAIDTSVLPCALCLILIATLASLVLSRVLSLLSLDWRIATSLGLNVKVFSALILTLAALLCGAASSYIGTAGFVGLIIPHIARKCFGTDTKHTLISSIILGGALVVACDILARVAFSPYEIPVGTLLSLLGVPFFIILLFNTQKNPV